MDIFCEQLVVKKTTLLDWLKRLGIVIAALILFYISFVILPQMGNTIGSIFSSLGVIIAIGAGYGAWYLITATKIEYEYILTNGELDVDKIIAQRKRKRLASINLREVSDFGIYQPEKHQPDAYNATIYACSDPKDPGTYYAIVPEHKVYGKCMLIFNPNDAVLENAKQYLRRTAIR